MGPVENVAAPIGMVAEWTSRNPSGVKQKATNIAFATNPCIRSRRHRRHATKALSVTATG